MSGIISTVTSVAGMGGGGDAVSSVMGMVGGGGSGSGGGGDALSSVMGPLGDTGTSALNMVMGGAGQIQDLSKYLTEDSQPDNSPAPDKDNASSMTMSL